MLLLLSRDEISFPLTVVDTSGDGVCCKARAASAIDSTRFGMDGSVTSKMTSLVLRLDQQKSPRRNLLPRSLEYISRRWENVPVTRTPLIQPGNQTVYTEDQVIRLKPFPNLEILGPHPGFYASPRQSGKTAGCQKTPECGETCK